jgi:hypothetical protein
MITVTYAQMVYLLATTGLLVQVVKTWFRMPKCMKMVPWVAITTRVMKCLAGPRAEHTPPSTTTTTPSIWAIVGLASALVGAACAFAKWKQKMNAKLAIPTIPTTVATTSSSGPIVTATAVPQSANVYNTPMLSQRNITLVNQC